VLPRDQLHIRVDHGTNRIYNALSSSSRPAYLLSSTFISIFEGWYSPPKNIAAMARNPDWYIPNYIPHNSLFIAVLLVLASMITSATYGYDGSMMNGLNILPSYNDYFNLNPATTGE